MIIRADVNRESVIEIGIWQTKSELTSIVKDTTFM